MGTFCAFFTFSVSVGSDALPLECRGSGVAWRAHSVGGGEARIAEALVMAVGLLTALLNLYAALVRVREAEQGRTRRCRGGRHLR